MANDALNSTVLQAFLLDAQILLTQAEECLQHLALIDNDPDACHCLNDTLSTLVARARILGLVEVASYSEQLQYLLETTRNSSHLPGSALPALGNCLTLLAWQLELVDPCTGHLDLDTEEQVALLDNLATALNTRLACAPDTSNMPTCVHASHTLHAATEGSMSGN